MDTQQVAPENPANGGQTAGSSGQPSNSTASSTASLSGSEPAAPESTGSAEPDAPDAGARDAEALTQLSKILLAVVPALTVALAAVGGATGGLARMFRDQTGIAQASIALIFLAFALAALARLPATTSGSSAVRARRRRQRSLILLASGLVLVIGIALAFNAQIIVMGYGQAPVVTGTVTPTSAGDALDAHVIASGVKSNNRIVVLAFESSDEHGDIHSNKVPLYYSKSGPDPDGKVDVHVTAQVPNSSLQAYPYLFVTAVLGEQQRDCDGAPIEGGGPPDPDATACLTLQRSGAATPVAPPSPPAPAPATPSALGSAPTLSSPKPVEVTGAVAWTRTALYLTHGQRFDVRATGEVSFIQNAPPVGPDGARDKHPGACVLAGPDHHAALIGRILGPSPGTPFLVGSSFDGQANQSGELELGINDIGVDNNGGAFHASVQIATTT